MSEFLAGAALVAFIAFAFYRISRSNKSEGNGPSSGEDKTSPGDDRNPRIKE